MKTKFLPRDEAQRVVWFNNFSSKLKNTYALIFGITIATADKIVAYAAFYAFLIGYLKSSRTLSQDLTKYKDDFFTAPLNTPNGALPVFTVVPPATIPAEAGVYTIVSGIIQTIKSHAAYTNAIGEDLGIVGDEHDFDETTFKTVLKATVQLDGVKIAFTKKGVEGIHIYSNPLGEFNGTTWELLALDLHSPYLDSRPAKIAGTPEDRRYMGRGVIDGKEVGVDSDIVVVTFSPAVIAGGHGVVN